MKQIEIKRWDNNDIIVCGKYEDVRDSILKNSDKSFYRADLSSADLRSADLRSADLSSANLRYANLSSANLRYANLSSANLRSADLSSADLSSADLRSADLRSANLSYADLSPADLSSADLRSADLSYANLRYADLRSANLRYANLSYADLSYANLRSANLRYADLRSANLSYADLSYANLSYADYKEPLFLPDLYSLKLLHKATKLVYWKYLTNGKTPYQNATYEIGKVYTFSNCNSNENDDCGEGGNIATLIWCLKDSSKADEFLQIEFQVKDIVAIPYTTDGKFRVKKFKVLKKLNRKQVLKLLTNAMKGDKK